jgi:hypothetical protein
MTIALGDIAAIQIIRGMPRRFDPVWDYPAISGDSGLKALQYLGLSSKSLFVIFGRSVIFLRSDNRAIVSGCKLTKSRMKHYISWQMQGTFLRHLDDTPFPKIISFAFQSDNSGLRCGTWNRSPFMIEVKLAHFTIIHFLSLATSPVSDATGKSKRVMLQALEVSIHCRSNLRTVSERISFLQRRNSQKIELGLRMIQRERVSNDEYSAPFDSERGLISSSFE